MKHILLECLVALLIWLAFVGWGLSIYGVEGFKADFGVLFGEVEE